MEIFQFALKGGLFKHFAHHVDEHVAELLGADIFVAGGAFLEPVDDLHSSVDADIARDESLLKIVEDIVVDLALSGYGVRNFAPHSLLRFLQAGVERFLLLLRK